MINLSKTFLHLGPSQNILRYQKAPKNRFIFSLTQSMVTLGDAWANSLNVKQIDTGLEPKKQLKVVYFPISAQSGIDRDIFKTLSNI